MYLLHFILLKWKADSSKPKSYKTTKHQKIKITASGLWPTLYLSNKKDGVVIDLLEEVPSANGCTTQQICLVEKGNVQYSHLYQLNAQKQLTYCKALKMQLVFPLSKDKQLGYSYKDKNQICIGLCFSSIAPI